jgi:uncharacterized membrane protein HdeD (DUF308 family)
MQAVSRFGTVLGIATLILGLLSIFSPGISGVSVTFLVGVLMMAAGVARLAFAFKSETFGRGVLMFLLGAVSIFAGGVIMARPLLGMVSLTGVLVVFFAVDGVVEIIGAFKARPAKGSSWMIFSGIMSIILAGLIGYQWPFSGMWAVGVLVGVRLIFVGWSMVALGSAGDVVYTEAIKRVTGK